MLLYLDGIEFRLLFIRKKFTQLTQKKRWAHGKANGIIVLKKSRNRRHKIVREVGVCVFVKVVFKKHTCFFKNNRMLFVLNYFHKIPP